MNKNKREKASSSSGWAGRINPLKFCCLLRKGIQDYFFFLRNAENSFKNTKRSTFSLNYRVGVGEGTAWLLFCAAGCIFWWQLFHFNALGLDSVLLFLVCLLFWTHSEETLSFSLGNFGGFHSNLWRLHCLNAAETQSTQPRQQPECAQVPKQRKLNT